MSKSKAKKEAIRKAKRRKVIITSAVCIVIAAAITAAVIMLTNREVTERVFTAVGASVTLDDDGTFKALLWHGDTKIGTYSENEENGVIIVTFTYDESIADGRIDGRVLYIPDEWDDLHGHGVEFTLR